MSHPTFTRVLFALLVAGFALPGFAADANFQAFCIYDNSIDRFVCEFDAQRAPAGQPETSCDPAVPERYNWRFGDGTSTTTTTPETDHAYLPTGGSVPTLFGPGIYEACMQVGCSDGETAYRCHCVDLNGTSTLPNCITPGAWTPL